MSAYDAFGSGGLDSPAMNDADVAPNDSTDLPGGAARSLYITGAGNIRYTTVGGQTVTRTVPANFVLPVRVKRVHLTGTTATGICAWW